ncbi:T-cell surface glycoprotein YE1/48-like [Nannospalax galili]|uniref:T-cell surface glycoprotein YE1/48-like n=1 Tax=Nannospalax galili TaxID=1026970 RepID=UPI0004ED5EC3|nr:T-cell surface glycoprotein YE1/48-like [Nannospalax galili]
MAQYVHFLLYKHKNQISHPQNTGKKLRVLFCVCSPSAEEMKTRGLLKFTRQTSVELNLPEISSRQSFETSLTSKMSEQEESYSYSVFLKSSSEQQSRVKPGGTQGPKETEDRVLVFQHSQGKHHEENINLSQEYHIMLYELKLKEEMLKNKSIEYESLKNLTERKICHGKNKIILNCSKSAGKRFEGHLFCCGTKCYYVIMERKTWSGCRQICNECSLSLLKIDDSDEQDFLRSQVNGTIYWIGLSYDKQEKKWKWIGSGSSNLDLTALNLQSPGGTCAFFTSTRIGDSDCGKTYPCICEKRMDTFSDSVCNKKER